MKLTLIMKFSNLTSWRKAFKKRVENLAYRYQLVCLLVDVYKKKLCHDLLMWNRRYSVINIPFMTVEPVVFKCTLTLPFEFG